MAERPTSSAEDLRAARQAPTAPGAAPPAPVAPPVLPLTAQTVDTRPRGDRVAAAGRSTTAAMWALCGGIAVAVGSTMPMVDSYSYEISQRGRITFAVVGALIIIAAAATLQSVPSIAATRWGEGIAIVATIFFGLFIVGGFVGVESEGSFGWPTKYYWQPEIGLGLCAGGSLVAAVAFHVARSLARSVRPARSANPAA